MSSAEYVDQISIICSFPLLGFTTTLLCGGSGIEGSTGKRKDLSIK